MARAMGLDVGTRTVGIALSDPMYLIAQPQSTLWRTNLEADLNRLVALIHEQEVREIIVGLPKHMNNQMSDSARRAKSFGAELERRGFHVFYQDERRTTIQAEEVLKQKGVNKKRWKEKVDAIAASIILQAWLDIHRAHH